MYRSPYKITDGVDAHNNRCESLEANKGTSGSKEQNTNIRVASNSAEHEKSLETDDYHTPAANFDEAFTNEASTKGHPDALNLVSSKDEGRKSLPPRQFSLATPESHWSAPHFEFEPGSQAAPWPLPPKITHSASPSDERDYADKLLQVKEDGFLASPVEWPAPPSTLIFPSTKFNASEYDGSPRDFPDPLALPLGQDVYPRRLAEEDEFKCECRVKASEFDIRIEGNDEAGTSTSAAKFSTKPGSTSDGAVTKALEASGRNELNAGSDSPEEITRSDEWYEYRGNENGPMIVPELANTRAGQKLRYPWGDYLDSDIEDENLVDAEPDSYKQNFEVRFRSGTRSKSSDNSNEHMQRDEALTSWAKEEDIFQDREDPHSGLYMSLNTVRSQKSHESNDDDSSIFAITPMSEINGEGHTPVCEYFRAEFNESTFRELSQHTAKVRRPLASRWDKSAFFHRRPPLQRSWSEGEDSPSVKLVRLELQGKLEDRVDTFATSTLRRYDSLPRLNSMENVSRSISNHRSGFEHGKVVSASVVENLMSAKESGKLSEMQVKERVQRDFSKTPSNRNSKKSALNCGTPTGNASARARVVTRTLLSPKRAKTQIAKLCTSLLGLVVICKKKEMTFVVCERGANAGKHILKAQISICPAGEEFTEVVIEKRAEDGKILDLGDFYEFCGAIRQHLGKIENADAAV